MPSFSIRGELQGARRRKRQNPFRMADQPCERGFEMVGATGFEPATSCSRSRRATGLRYAPPNQPLPKDIVDAPGGTRIPNLLIRSQMLYPIELRALSKRRLHRPVKLAECRHGL